MILLRQLLICILITCRCSRALFLFRRRINNFMIKIDFMCPEGSLIDILYIRKKNENKEFGIVKEMTQKILRKCSMQQTCKTSLYSDHYNSLTMYELVIKYNCVEAENVISFCQNSQERPYRGDVYLVQSALSSTYTKACPCVATYSGHSYVSLTHIPTNKKYLKVTTWKSRNEPKDRIFRYHVYENVEIANYPEKQEFTFVNIPSETNDEDAFTLVKIKAKEEKSYVRLNCKEPAEYKEPGQTTENKVFGRTTFNLTHARGPEQVLPLTSYTQLIVTFVVATLCIIGIGVFAFILYRRHIKRKILKQKNGSATSGATGTDTDSVQYSIYIDASGRLRNSYAEIGSISDYRHYICLDDISQQSLTLTVQHAPAGDQGSIPINISDITEQQRLDTTLISEQDNCRVNKPDQKCQRAAAGKDVMNMTSGCKDNDKGVRRSFVNTGSRSASRVISQEHYDLFGYLSLNSTERTTNASLKKWKKEIYSIEKQAREIYKNRQTAAEEENSVGQRNVRIVVKPHSSKPPGYPYHYVKNQVIKFDEIEVYTKPNIGEERPTTEDKGSI